MVSGALAISFTFQAREKDQEEALCISSYGGRILYSLPSWLCPWSGCGLSLSLSVSDYFLLRRNIQGFTYFTKKYPGLFIFNLNPV
jgi:hypothetical protein